MKTNVIMIAMLLGVGVVIGATLNFSSDDSPDATEPARHKTAPDLTSQVGRQPANPFAANTARSTEYNGENNGEYAHLKSALSDLQQKFEKEVEKRRQLERKIAVLEETVTGEATTIDDTQTESNSQFSVTSSPHQLSSAEQDTNWFNDQALVEAGVDPSRVDYIKDAFEQAELEKLYLRDQATREGWMGTQRYRDAVRKIADRTKSLQSELTTSEYDAYLYATGRPNRVIVSSVLGGSPADNAGIKAGDTILQYGNKRIYSWNDLTTATSEGSPDTTVTVTVARDGQQQQVYVPRGPLGIRLTTDSVLP